MTPDTPTAEERSEFIQRLPVVMHEAGRLGLWKTMHALHEVIQTAGWEMAEKVPELRSTPHDP